MSVQTIVDAFNDHANALRRDDFIGPYIDGHNGVIESAKKIFADEKDRYLPFSFIFGKIDSEIWASGVAVSMNNLLQKQLETDVLQCREYKMGQKEGLCKIIEILPAFLESRLG